MHHASTAQSRKTASRVTSSWGLLFIAAAAHLALETTAQAEAETRPNIVLIVADDLGWADVSYHAKRAETPNIDRLVHAGAELDTFYVAPMCSPTRAGLMTGRYPIRFGLARAVIPPHRDFGLDPSETTLPEVLATLGYQNRGVFGKWHLGHLRPQWHPLSQGFTHFHGHYNGAIDYFELTREGVRDWHQDWQPSDEQGYSTSLITDAACDWIKESAKANSPYFCYVPFNAPHSPFQALDEDLKRYESIGQRGRNQDKENNGRRKQASQAEKRQTIAAMIWRMDVGVGQILDAIESTGESHNTIVWFTSDNGGVPDFLNNNTPLRGNKLDAYEGGIRVPAAVKWPDVIPAGVQRKAVTGYIDVLPTLVAAAAGFEGSNLKEPTATKPLDGVNLLPYLAGDIESLPARDWYTYHGQQGEGQEKTAIRSGQWKLVVQGPRLNQSGITASHRHELFHITDDPYEKTDIANDHKDVIGELAAKLVAFRTLQPADSVPPYGVKTPGFKPPAQWQLSPE